MEVSAIMDIYALAENRKVKSDGKVSGRQFGEGIKKDSQVSSQDIKMAGDLVAIGRNVPRVDMKKQVQVSTPLNGKVVGILT